MIMLSLLSGSRLLICSTRVSMSLLIRLRIVWSVPLNASNFARAMFWFSAFSLVTAVLTSAMAFLMEFIFMVMALFLAANSGGGATVSASAVSQSETFVA